MVKTSATSGKRSGFNPIEKFSNREHPMLAEESPLNRQLLRATGMPDMKALLHALAHPMEEGDLHTIAEKAGGHLAHHHRVRHLRKMALEQHGPIEAYSPDKPMQKSVWGRRLSMGGEWYNQYLRNKKQGDKTTHYKQEQDRANTPATKQDSLAGGMDFGDNQRITRNARGNYSGWQSPNSQNWEQFLRAPGQSLADAVKNIGSRGAHWYVDRLGHKQYGTAPPPFRARVHDDSDQDDQHIKTHFSSLGIPDEWHGNQILYAEPKEIHAHALALAAATNREPKEWEDKLKQKQLVAREQFRQATSVRGMSVRRTVALRERDIKEYKPHIQPKEKPPEDPRDKAKYYHHLGEDQRMARLHHEFYHTVPTGRNVAELDEQGQPKRVPVIDPKTGEQAVYGKGAKAGQLKWQAVLKPEIGEALRPTGIRVNKGKLQRGSVKRDERGKPILDEKGKPTFDYEDVMEDRDVPIPDDVTRPFNVPQEDASGNLPVVTEGDEPERPKAFQDIDPIYVGRILKIWHSAPVEFREEQRKWYSSMARQYIKDLADASGYSEVKAAGVLALFNNGMGWNVGAAGAAQLLLGDSLGLTYVRDEKYSDEERAAGSPEYKYRMGDPREVLGDTYPDVLAKMRRIINARSDREAMKITKKIMSTNKLGDFWMDMMGSDPWVTGTLDRHMVGVFGHKVYGTNSLTGKKEWYQKDSFGEGEYRYFHRAFLAASQQIGVEPRELQAVAWVVYQGLHAADSTTGAAFNPKALAHIKKVVVDLAARHRLQRKRGIRVQHSKKRKTPEKTFQNYFSNRNLGREAGFDPVTNTESPEVPQQGESKGKF